MELDVALVRWPADDARRRELAERSIPRLLLVEKDAEPPGWIDHLEDWVRLPASQADTRARATALAERAQQLSPAIPVIDGDGTMRYRSERVRVSAQQRRLLEPLIEQFGTVVSRHTVIEHAWPDRSPAANTLDVHMSRLRRALQPHGLHVRTIRSRGFLLTGSEEDPAC